MSKAVQLLSVLTILVLPVPGRAQMALSDTQQVLVLHGTVAADRKAAEKIGYAAITIGFTGAPPETVCWLGVVEAEAAGGDAFLGRDIIAAIDPYTPSLLAAGKASTLDTLRKASAGSRLIVTGIVDSSARTFLVSSVRTAPASSGH